MIVNGVNTANEAPEGPPRNEQGGIIDQDMPIDASNVMFVHKGKTDPRRLQDPATTARRCASPSAAAR